MPMTAEQAFHAYEAVRHRLPDAVKPRHPCRRVRTLADVADEFDTYLLDAFGVLNIGDTAIAGTKGRIDDLRAVGKRVIVVSNAASVPRASLAAKYRTLGYDFPPEDIITSRAAMVAGLADRPSLHWGAMSLDASLFGDLGDLRLSLLRADPETYDAVDGFLLIGSGDWSEDRQNLLETSLRRRPRSVLVANPDIVAPREHGFSTEPGSYAHRLADRTDVVPEFYGKPFHNIYDLAFDRLGPVDKSRTLMVGDSLHTDILGAQASGITGALVADYGFFADWNADVGIAQSGIIPDLILDRP